MLTTAIIEKAAREALAEDSPWGDLTSDNFLPVGVPARLGVKLKQEGVICGLALAGENEEAIDHLVEALRLDPALIEAGNYLAHVLVMADDIDESIAGKPRYQAVAGVRRARALAHVIAGERHLEAGAAGDALREYQRALEIDPVNAVARARIAAAMKTSAISSVPTAP